MGRKAKIGRPRKYTAKEIRRLYYKFEIYIEETEIPIIAEFAYKNNLSKDFLYDTLEFSELLKSCISKKETALETKCLKGEVNPAMAIFSLKQIGWRDKQEIDIGIPVRIKVSLDDEKEEEKIIEGEVLKAIESG